MKVTGTRFAVLGATVLAAALVLSGCSSDSGDLAKQYGNGTTQNYISGDGAVTEVAVDKRTDPVGFSAKTTDGETLSSKALRGKVVVLNYWYASCPPCRAEAKYLREVAQEYAGKDVQIIGVNVRDEAPTAAAFDRTFKVGYPTVLDASSGDMQLALAGQLPPNAVPATIVIDTKGRVAARILGAVDGAGILDTLVSDELRSAGGAS